MAARKAVLEARADAADAKLAADSAARKADDSLAAETRILHAVEQMQAPRHETAMSLTGLSQHVTDLEHQVDRIEKKQDNTLQN